MVWGCGAMGWGQNCTITVSPSSLVFCGSGEVSVSVPSASNTRYTWEIDGVPSTETTNVLLIPFVKDDTKSVKVTVTDTLMMVSCTGDTMLSATVHPNPTLEKVKVDNVTCNGYTTGFIQVMASDGASPYNYQLGTTMNTDGKFSNLKADTYAVSVSDANGCTATLTDIVVSEPPILELTPMHTDASCGDNGTITITPAGGNGGGNVNQYKYFYKKGTGTTYQENTGNVIKDLSSGDYYVKIQDAEGCESTVSFVKVDASPGPMIAIPTLQIMPVKCNGESNGSFVAIASGGGGNYTFSVLPDNGTKQASGNTLQVTNLPAGNYTVAVQAGACPTTDSENVTIDAPPVLTGGSAVGVAPTSCNGKGSITLSGTAGGNGGYMYSIATPPTPNSFQSGKTFSNVASGSYTITVKDVKGCTTTLTATVGPAPGGITLGVPEIVDAKCVPPNSGEAKIPITGNTASLTIKLDGTPQTLILNNGKIELSNLAPKTGLNKYQLVALTPVCSDTITFEVPKTPSPTATTISTPANCSNLSSGSATASALPLGPDYKFVWNTGAMGPVLSVVPPSTYTVTVTNTTTGCTVTATATVGQDNNLSNLIQIGVGPSNIVCQNEAVTLVVQQPQPQPDLTKWNYSWAPSGAGTFNIAANTVTSGTFTYTVTLTSKSNAQCTGTSTASYTVKPRPAPTGATLQYCFGDTSYQLAPTTLPIPPFTTQWKKGSTLLGTTLQQTITQQGTYTVEINKDNCIGSADFNITSKGDLPTQKTIFHKSPSTNHLLIYPQSGLCYQWLRKLKTPVNSPYDPIAGETQQYYFVGKAYDTAYDYFVRVGLPSPACPLGDCYHEIKLREDAPIIPDDPTSFSVRVAPNPNDGAFALEMEGLERGPVDVQIFDVMGHLVESRREAPTESVFTMPFRLDDRLASGVYYLRLYDQGGSLLTVRPMVVVR